MQILWRYVNDIQPGFGVGWSLHLIWRRKREKRRGLDEWLEWGGKGVSKREREREREKEGEREREEREG